MRLLLLILLLFFGYSSANLAISYEEYLELASENNWPQNQESFDDFLNFCNNLSTSQTSEQKDPDNSIFASSDCLRLTSTSETPELSTIQSVTASPPKPLSDGTNLFQTVYQGNNCDNCLMKTSVPTTTPTPTPELTTFESTVTSTLKSLTTTPLPTIELTTTTPSRSPHTTELTTITTTTETNSQTIIIDGSDRFILDGADIDCDNCLSQTSTSSSLLPITSTTSLDEATTSVQILKSSTKKSMTSENPETSESTEQFATDFSNVFETSTKPGSVSTEIPSTITEVEVSSSSYKSTTSLTTTKSSTSSQQKDTTTEKSETITKKVTDTSSTSPLTSVKTTKVETTPKSTASTASTKLPTTTTKSLVSPSSSATTTQKTTTKTSTPETTLSENAKTTEEKSVTTSTTTKSSVLDTSKTSVTSIPEHTTTQASDATSTLPQDETTTSTASVTVTTPSSEKASTTVTKDTSTMFDESPSTTVPTTTKYSTSTQTTAEKKRTSSATTNTVTEPMPQSPTETTTMSGHLQTDPPTPAASTTPKDYLTTTPDEKPSSTTLQHPPTTTKDNDVKSLGTTTVQNDKILTTTSKVDKLPSTTVIQGTTTTSGIEATSSTKIQTMVGTSSSTTVLATKTSTDTLEVEISTSKTTVPKSSSASDADTTMTTTTPETKVEGNKISSPASTSKSTTTTKMPSTKLPELETTKSVASTSESRTSKSSDSETTPPERTSSTKTTVPNNAENQKTVTSPLPKTTSTSEESTSLTATSTPTVTPTTSEKPSTPTVTSTTIEDNNNPAFGDQTSTESMKSTTTKIPSSTVEDKTTSSKMASDKVTVSPKASTSSTISASENEKTTSKSSSEETMTSTTNSVPGSSSTTTSTSKSSKKATKTATQSTVQPAESTTSSPTAQSDPSTDPSSTPPPKTRKTTTKRPTSTSTQSPICNSICPPGFSEAENACFKFIHSNSTEGTYFDDFLNACTSMKGVIASLSDYANLKNVGTFKTMTNSQNPQPAMVFVNAVPSKYFRRTQIVPVIELANYSYANFQVIGLSATEKYPNVSVICRVGKHCQAYTCPVMEYFIPPTAKYLAADVQVKMVLKAGEKLSVQCTATPMRTFEVKCDPRGFLLPDSSFITCDAKNEIKSEPNGPVKSCSECDKLQTASCQPLPSGEFYCNCKELYDGKTCTYPINACENVTCENGGTCINRYTYAFCQCEPEYFGSVCQYEFYGSYEAWVMRAMAYTVTAVAAAEHAVRTKKQLTPSAPGRFGTLPTEVAKFYSSIFGALALMFRIMFEFPDSEGLADQIQCSTTFVITMSLAFCSLTAMAAESVIALGVVINATTNCFDGHYRNRKKCVDNWRFTIFYATFSIIPFVILCAFSSEMVTPHSCIGVLPFPDFPDGQQYAGLGLVALMSIYTLLPFGLALIAKHYVDHNIFATRRRYDADLVDPTAYGREILPIELNVRYYLLALKPVFFTIAWFSFITAAEKMAWWATWLATICSGIYGIISFLQNQLTVYENLDATIVRAMNWLPKKYAPNYNYITLRTRNDYLKVRNPEKYQKEQEEKLNGGPAVQFPIPFDQNLERLMRTDKPGVLNRSAFFKLVPTGLHKIIIKKWKLQYLRLRAAGHSQGGAIRLIWWDIQNEKLATPLIPFTTIIPMFVNFWDNCRHWDRLDDLDTRSKKVLQRGVEMLEIKPLMKIEVAKVLNSTKNRNVKFFRDDPLMNFEQQKIAFERLEQICKSFTPEDLEKDEIETVAYVRKYFYYCYKRRSHLTKRVLDNRRRTVRDFLLDERRPNFVGPRTFENQIPPGITYLEHTAYYWEFLNYETWKRLRIQAKYISLNVELRYEYNLWDEIFPWNWEKHSRDPNLIFDPSKYRAFDLPNILEENEDLEDESEDNSEDEN